MSEIPPVSRRSLLGAGLGTAVAVGAASPAWALVATPWQTPGPFYPDRVPLDSDTDLIHVAGQDRPANGIPTQVFGQVLDEDGRPIAGARVELWQCDAFGQYHHPRDRGGHADPAFQGYGRMAAGDDGGYRFLTIKPVSYPGRTPHIHFAVSGPGIERLTTQMYVAGEPLNARDGLYNRIRDERARASVTVDLVPDTSVGPDGLSGRFDIVLGRDFISS